MKKVININFQGRVIPIEEDAYENLKKYVESLRQYFAKEEGKEEIINDIENRIAELFSEKLKNGPQPFITEESVAGIIAGIGRPEEFDGDNIEMGSTSSSSSYTESKSTSGGFEPRGSLFRNENDKMLGGVCSGLAVYLRIDATIVRILFVLFALGAFGTGLLLYIILWAVLPSKIHKEHITRRLYRDADNKVLGGVCSGIAKYFNVAVWIPRLIFLLPVIMSIFKNVVHIFYFPVVFSFSGTLILTYLILWAVIPKAITASEKLEMKGEKVDLESIKNKVQNEMQGVGKNFSENTDKWKQEFSEKASGLRDEAKETARRFAGEAGPVLKRGGSGIGHIILGLIKVFVFFVLGIITISLLAALVALFVTGTALMPLKDFAVNSDQIQLYGWGILIFFLSVPVIGIVISLVRRITGKKSRNHYVTYSFLVLWLVGLVSVILLVASISRQFNRVGTIRKEVAIAQPSVGRMLVDFKDVEGSYYPMNFDFGIDDHDLDRDMNGLRLSASEDSLLIQNIRIRLEKSRDNNFHVTIIRRARASSPLDAEKFADMISYSVSQTDSILTLPQSFPITTESKFRNQQVIVEIEVPVGKEIYIDGKADNLHWYSVYGGVRGLSINIDNSTDYDYSWRTGVWYKMTEGGVENKYNDENEKLNEIIEKAQKGIGDGKIDSVNMKFKNGDTTIDIKIHANAMLEPADNEDIVESDEPTSWKGKRILFSAMDLLRIAK